MPVFEKADMLLPENIKDNWAVIACDQFTSDKQYWESVEKTVGEDLSAYNLILPEIYLNDNPKERIEKINSNMKDYVKSGVFKEYKDSMIYVSRTQSDGKILNGIVGCIDLSEYDYKESSKKLIRASEKTVVERIPPRVEIRKDAILEFPHILLLIDDPNFSVIEQVKIKECEKLYDLELMLGGGSVSGYLMNDNQTALVQNALEKLIENCDDKLLFAVGDGNHSLATAKKCAEITKSPLAEKALVEIVNIHSDAIQFEPIYRVLFGCDPEKVISDFISFYSGEYSKENAQYFTAVFAGEQRKIGIKPASKLPVGTLQKFLDDYLADNPEIKIDYIHGESETKALCKTKNTLGFLFEGMKKDELFEAIRLDGSLPRKTFSMGQAKDKRYYIEGRKIR